MQNSPTISVVMPVHGEVKYINEAIQSILEQSWVDLELIVVNDRLSQEATKQVERIVSSNQRMKLVKSDGVGISEALNKGISLSRGHFIARMDSDDISDKFRLENQIHFMQSHPEVGVLGTQITYINQDGHETGRSNFPTSNKSIARDLYIYNCIAHPTVMMRKSTLEEIGLYDSRYDGSEDYELWNRAIQKTAIRNLDIPLLQYRESELQVTKSRSRIPERQEKVILWERLFTEVQSEDNQKRILSKIEQTHSTLILRGIYHAKNRDILLKDLIKENLRGNVPISIKSILPIIQIISKRLFLKLNNYIGGKK